MLELYMPWTQEYRCQNYRCHGLRNTDVRTIYAMDLGIQMLELYIPWTQEYRLQMLELYMPWTLEYRCQNYRCQGLRNTDVRTIYPMDLGIQMLEFQMSGNFWATRTENIYYFISDVCIIHNIFQKINTNIDNLYNNKHNHDLT